MKIVISSKGTLVGRYLSVQIIKDSKPEPEKQREAVHAGKCWGSYGLSSDHAGL